MQDLIKRYFWVLGGVTVMVCAVFAAKATGHVLEAKLLGDSENAPKITPAAPRPDAPVKPTHAGKDGVQLATRNMFCSECTPAAPTVGTVDPSQIAITQLPLQLLATSIIGTDDKQSSATVINIDSQKQGSYSVGDTLPGATGKVKTIRYKFVDFEHNGRIERVMLVGAAPITTVAAAEPDKPAGEGGDEMQVAIDTGIKKIDDNTFEIDKSLIEKVTANPMAFMKGARVVPAMKNGKPEGIKLYAIRPTSPYAKLGLTNGDTLSSINGFELTSVDKGLEIYAKLREATSLEVEIVRRGKPVTLKYTIR
ncbi:MAG: ral secretion pathway protein [Deltaproteobacteria bacterium]|nr:ral secretion pathway protein [Deltaproteobacteria bacterium]